MTCCTIYRERQGGSMLSIDDAPALCPEVGDDGVIELHTGQRSPPHTDSTYVE